MMIYVIILMKTPTSEREEERGGERRGVREGGGRERERENERRVSREKREERARVRTMLILDIRPFQSFRNICGEEQALRRVLTVRNNDPSISVSHKE
jgi:hypothetical protein